MMRATSPNWPSSMGDKALVPPLVSMTIVVAKAVKRAGGIRAQVLSVKVDAPTADFSASMNGASISSHSKMGVMEVKLVISSAVGSIATDRQ